MYRICFSAEMTTVVCDDDVKINLLLDKAPPCLRRLVHIKDLRRETIARAKKQGIELLKFEEVERLGSAHSHNYRERVREFKTCLNLFIPFD